MTVNSLVSKTEVNRNSLKSHDGIGAFVVLVDSMEQIVNAKLVDGKYGLVWLVYDADDEEAFGRKWIPADGSHLKDDRGSRSRVQKELGLCQRIELADARLSRHGDIIRTGEWPKYGSWKGYPHWTEDDHILKS